MANEIELFTKLLKEAHLVSESDLTEAVSCAKRLEIPLERALTMLKVASNERLRPAIKAKELVCAGKISLSEASRILKHASENNISFEEALPQEPSSTSSSKSSVIRLSSGAVIHPLADFFLTLKLVSPDQLNLAVHNSQTMNLPLGKTLVINRFITRWTLGEVLSATILVKDKVISKEQAFGLLKDSLQHQKSIIQLLFESGNYRPTSGDNLTLVELLLLADCITEADFQDIEERRLINNISQQQIISEYKIVESKLLASALELLGMIGNYLKPFQAAEALKQIKIKKIPVYQAITELKPPPQIPLPQLRLGDLLVEAGIVSRDKVEKTITNTDPKKTLARIGKLLLDSQVIEETSLYNALRCQSLYREGILSAKQTLAILSCAHDEKIKLEDAFTKCGVNALIRMQWNWN